MKLSCATLAGLVGVLFLGATVWAAVDPLTLEQIPEGQKYSKRTLAELQAKRMNTREEGEKVDAVMKARATYTTALEGLKAFYVERGNAEGLRKVTAELEDLQKARQFVSMNWEETLGELTTAQKIPEADKLLADADKLRGGFHPFSKTARLREAAELYKKILTDYPNSSATHAAAFHLGEIYATGSIGEYYRAVKFYELSYLANPEGEFDAVYKAAQVCDNDLTDYERAARYYWLATTMGRSAITRQFSSTRLRQLQEEGFGTQYTAREEPAPPPAEALEE